MNQEINFSFENNEDMNCNTLPLHIFHESLIRFMKYVGLQCHSLPSCIFLKIYFLYLHVHFAFISVGIPSL